jgi:hypothetical protein
MQRVNNFLLTRLPFGNIISLLRLSEEQFRSFGTQHPLGRGIFIQVS